MTRLKIQKIINFLKKDNTVIFLIIVLAYILRTLPYILGYSIPFTEDGLRDFEQVKYIIENGKLNLFNSYQNFGSFPLLHLIVFAISRLGIDAMKVFLFIPQIFASLGILFYYLFLKKYFTKKQALLACFLIATFPAHIHWSAQPVRETIGLFLFPLIIYFFDREIKSNKENIKYKLELLFALILIIFAHHWSTLMTGAWLIFYSLLFIENKREFYKASFYIFTFGILSLIYWNTFFALPINMMRSFLFSDLGWRLIILSIILILFVLFKKYNLNKLKRNIYLKITTVVVIIISLLSFKILPIDYPLQLYFTFILFLIFISIGFFSSKNDNINRLLLTTTPYIIIFLFGLFEVLIIKNNILKALFDPFRVFEFIIFPLSMLGAIGILKINEKIKYSKPIIIILLIITATFTYPPIFIYKNNFAGTPFYDIRSDIRYISPETMEAIKWANANNYNTLSDRPEIRTFQEIFFTKKGNNAVLITKSDELINNNYNLIKDPIIKTTRDQYNNADKNNIIYSNNEDFLALPLYDFELISHNFPSKIQINKEEELIIEIKNSGTKEWLPEDNYFLFDNINWEKIKIEKNVLPGDMYIFKKMVNSSNEAGTFYIKLNMKKNDLSDPFGGWTAPIKVTVFAPEK